MHRLLMLLPLLLLLTTVVACSEQKAILPTAELTEEQMAAIKVEDAKVADEESHGTAKKKRK